MRQPRTMRSRRIRKNLSVRALRMERMPAQMLKIMPAMARTVAVCTAVWTSRAITLLAMMIYSAFANRGIIA